MTTTGPGIEFGTNYDSEMIALRGVRLTATLAGGSLEAKLEQTFVNLESAAIEAVYTFPLPETAAVCGFEVRTGDHVLTGKVEESDDALKQYDEAIAGGHGAYLLEQDRPDVFTVRAGNLKPRQAATIGISYIAPLERVDRSIRVRFPTTIAPRYVSAAGSTDPLQTALDSDALNPPHVLHVPYGVEMRIEVRLGPEVRGITSSSHPLSVRRPHQDGDLWVVTFAGKLAEMDRDIVLELETARETQPQVQVAAGPGDSHYLALTFVPEFDEAGANETRPSETVFVIDCSGSMQGQSARQATMALELCLRSLNTDDHFNICRFGSSRELMSSSSVPYSSAALEKALKFIRRDADLGGTEIYSPLEEVFRLDRAVRGVRNVVVLTDGQVSNEPAVIELARKWSADNRIFSFGIGSAASGYLVRSLARVTHGAAEFITGSERIEDKVLRTFSRIGSPRVSEAVVKWDDLDLQTPAEIPAVFDGDVLRVFARAPGMLPENVTLECLTPAGRKSWTLAVGAPINDNGVIARSWARAMIQSWEDADELPNTSRARRESTTARRLVAISKQFNILCSRTSFIAVEHRSLEERNNGLPELRRVPVNLAAGWGGIDTLADAHQLCDYESGDYDLTRTLFCGTVPDCMSEPMVHELHEGCIDFDETEPDERAPGLGAFGYSRGLSESEYFGDIVDKRLGTWEKITGLFKRLFGKAAASLPAAPPPDASHAGTVTIDLLHLLLARQSAEGWFGEDARDLLRAAGHDFAALEVEAAAVGDRCIGRPAEQRARIVTTALVLMALRRWFGDRMSVWRRADQKARQLLGKATGLDWAGVERLLDAKPAAPVTS